MKNNEGRRQHVKSAQLQVMPNTLATGWTTTVLGDLLTIVRGVSYKKKDARSQFSQGLVPILRATNIGGVLNFRDLIYVPDRYVKQQQILNFGDIVVAASSGSRAVVGKAAQLRREWIGSFGAFCFALRPDEGLVKEYVAWFLQTQEYRNRVSELSAGVNINNLKREHIEQTPIPLPPLPEQRRIVSEIEKHFTRLEASVAALKRVQANLKRYRASVLKSACEGKLVPAEAELARSEGRDYEPADRLLERTLSERRAHWESQENRRGKYKEPTSPDTTDLPELPEGWMWSKIGDVFEVYVGSTPRRARSDFWNGDIPWVSSGEVSFSRIKATRECITEEGLKNSNVTLHPKGTVLLGMIGEGKTRGQVSILDIPACNNQNSAAIRVSESGLPPEFVFYYLWGQYDATRRIGSGNNQPALNKSRVQELSMPLPPLAEQGRIVAEVERRLSVIQQTEALVEANLTRAERLRQSILKQAFSGKLVPQDPDDEPASVLLERIRAERAEAEAAAKAQRRPRRRRTKSTPATRPKLSEAAR